MRKMKWSSALATAAQNVANNCREESSRTAGENIFQDYFSTPETVIANIGAKASGAWVRDLEKLGWNSNKIDKATLGSKIAAATQMAWAETEFVGCGFNNCGKDSSKGNKSKILVVCHYKEIGNILNSNIYKEGDACSSCPTGYKCEGDSGLCVVGI
ncbi:hypothetical protein L5515_012405 [Caenorhabditis briggsae]|nr:hypothetical protein L3Y34_005321 [Caenorhabditis briggsae]UMM30598.1 hypothetical protein L5515_012405 [Caenorhabditis briggsae]